MLDAVTRFASKRPDPFLMTTPGSLAPMRASHCPTSSVESGLLRGAALALAARGSGRSSRRRSCRSACRAHRAATRAAPTGAWRARVRARVPSLTLARDLHARLLEQRLRARSRRAGADRRRGACSGRGASPTAIGAAHLGRQARAVRPRARAPPCRRRPTSTSGWSRRRRRSPADRTRPARCRPTTGRTVIVTQFSSSATALTGARKAAHSLGCWSNAGRRRLLVVESLVDDDVPVDARAPRSSLSSLHQRPEVLGGERRIAVPAEREGPATASPSRLPESVVSYRCSPWSVASAAPAV